MKAIGGEWFDNMRQITDYNGCKLIKLNKVYVPLPEDRVCLRDVGAIEVEIRCGPGPTGELAAVFMLSMDCKDVIEGFTTEKFDDGHTGDDDCETCHDNGWVNDEYEADCYRFDTIAMDAFEDSLADIPELRMFHKNVEHCIESDHWMITATRTEGF